MIPSGPGLETPAIHGSLQYMTGFQLPRVLLLTFLTPCSLYCCGLTVVLSRIQTYLSVFCHIQALPLHRGFNEAVTLSVLPRVLWTQSTTIVCMVPVCRCCVMASRSLKRLQIVHFCCFCSSTCSYCIALSLPPLLTVTKIIVIFFF